MDASMRQTKMQINQKVKKVLKSTSRRPRRWIKQKTKRKWTQRKSWLHKINLRVHFNNLARNIFYQLLVLRRPASPPYKHYHLNIHCYHYIPCQNSLFYHKPMIRLLSKPEARVHSPCLCSFFPSLLPNHICSLYRHILLLSYWLPARCYIHLS